MSIECDKSLVQILHLSITLNTASLWKPCAFTIFSHATWIPRYASTSDGVEPISTVDDTVEAMLPKPVLEENEVSFESVLSGLS